ncbi:MAG: M23 family metallopeptidase [Sphingomonadales bacterium]|nr:M23 family metallopeptidase [Sphingomonadales bacterium]
MRGWFPEREFFMRSEGQVRFIRISSRLQMRAAAAVAALALVWLGTMLTVTVSRLFEAQDRLSLLNREARVLSAENRQTAYRHSIGAVAEDLKRRQDFIDKVVQGHLGSLPSDVRPGETVSNSAGEAAKTVAKVSAAVPEAAGLARMEARQLAFVEGLTRYADRQSETASQRIRRLGLDPRMMLASMDRGEAMGGPFIPMATSADGSLDARFERLGLSLARMSALQSGLQRLPQVLPASLDYISSGFGYRSDPFTHSGAFHPGLDFRGPKGAPIYAAAKGRVSFVGQRSGYGNCVEIDHGNGLITRYAHMSGFRTTVGRQVGGGEQIGLIGSTGRSTGPHLHFEVRINDRPVNPRPFLEARNHVPQENPGPGAAGD